MGSMDKSQSFELLDAFVAAGGNFIDTGNNYQNEESEIWLGEWMAARKNRDQMVIAIKYTTEYRSWELGLGKSPNTCGNHKRSMFMSVRDTLKKLQTDFIDILYVHWWDHTTSIEEVMDSLQILVQQGKVLYLGISDSPAWVVSAANTYAKAHGKHPSASTRVAGISFAVRALTFVATMRSLRCELTSGHFDCGTAGAVSITLIVSSTSLDIALGLLLVRSHAFGVWTRSRLDRRQASALHSPSSAPLSTQILADWIAG
jgi:hypothetical protein